MNHKFLAAVVVAVVLSVSAGYWLGQSSLVATSAGGSSMVEGERKPLFYRDRKR